MILKMGRVKLYFSAFVVDQNKEFKDEASSKGKKLVRKLGGRHSTAVAFKLRTQAARVRFSVMAFPRKSFLS